MGFGRSTYIKEVIRMTVELVLADRHIILYCRNGVESVACHSFVDEVSDGVACVGERSVAAFICKRSALRVYICKP